MFWTEEIAAKCSGPQIINDSKTPSGRVHVGALRGVLIHDAIFRTLREKGIEARYLFGVDDFDPVDEIPKGEDEHFGQYIGRPLCNTPAPARLRTRRTWRNITWASSGRSSTNSA